MLVQWFLIAVIGLPFSAADLPARQSYNDEVATLMAVKSELNDINNVLYNWFLDADSPCDWVGVGCSDDGRANSLSLNNNNLSGNLSPTIGNLTRLQYLVLQNNSISGPIPVSIGKMTMLLALDMSNNKFGGSIPSSLGDLQYLHSLKLNNNNLTGILPDSVGNMDLDVLDLSFNNLSGPLPNISASLFSVNGNPLICGVSGHNCPTKHKNPAGGTIHHKSRKLPIGAIVAICVAAAAVCLVIIIGFVLYWWMCIHNQDANVVLDGHLNKYTFKQLSVATKKFSNLIGSGAFSRVYGGQLMDGTEVAVKKLMNINEGQDQIVNELKVVSLATHRNILPVIGYCYTEKRMMIVYPLMPNGSVDSKLHNWDQILSWSRRRTIALGTARGLRFLHRECNETILHCDIKATNVLLAENFEAVIGDYGLSKVFGHSNSHVSTNVCGTVGYVCPSYQISGQASDKTDVFAFGIFLFHLITGQKPSYFPNDDVRTWVNEQIAIDNDLALVIDSNLGSNYNHDELEKMVEVALHCTNPTPSERPKISEVVRMLEEDHHANINQGIQISDVPQSMLMTSSRNIDVGESSTIQEDEVLSEPR